LVYMCEVPNNDYIVSHQNCLFIDHEINYSAEISGSEFKA